MAGCLTPVELSRYETDALDAAERADVDAHLSTCDQCRDALEGVRRKQGSRGPASALALDTTESMSGSADSSPAARVSRTFPRIDGYRITGILGQGGMGTVYHAVQTKLDRTVALKVLHAVVATASPSAVSRFRREAAAAARLHHTNIIPIYDFGESRDGYFYAMELIAGQPLDVLIRQFAEQDAAGASPARLAEMLRNNTAEIGSLGEASSDARVAIESVDASRVGSSSGGQGRIYFRQVALWMMHAADALAYAHSQDIVHRDIKPSNLILSHDGRIMLADFGLAKTEGEQSVTMTGSLVGTLRYMSPEQAMAKRVRVDHRTDVYSLGATMYELLCFQPAYPGLDDKEVLGAIISREPAAPRKINHHVPIELQTICQKCMEKSAASRYDTARTLAEDLRRYLHDLPITAKRPGPIRRVVKFVRRRKAPVAIATAALLLAVGVPTIVHERAVSREEAIEGKYQSGMFFATNQKWSAAEREFREGLRRDPRHIKTLIGFAWMRLEQYKVVPPARGTKCLEDAGEFCQRVLRLQPGHAKALAYRGVTLRRKHEYAAAIDAFGAAIRAFQKTKGTEPLEYASWSNLGALYAITNDLDEAERCLENGAKLAGSGSDPWRGAAWRNLAVLEIYHRKVDAFEHIENALLCNKRDVLSWVMRARSRMDFEDHRDLEDALDRAKFADQLANEGDARAKRTRALAHLRNKQFPQAIKHAELALALGDQPTINHLIIAVSRAGQGHRDEAVKELGVAEAAWPADLKTSGGFHATADAGALWIDSADELLELRDEVHRLIEKPGA